MRLYGTVILGRVLSFQAVHSQIEQVRGLVPGDGEAAFGEVSVVLCTPITTYDCHPFQSLPRHLSHPVHCIAAEGEPGGSTGEEEGVPRPFDIPSRLHQLNQ